LDGKMLEQNYGPILAWVATECDERHPASETSIEHLRSALEYAAEAKSMPEVRSLFRSKWWNIKAELERMQRPYIEYSEYQKLCQKEGVTDSLEQEKLDCKRFLDHLTSTFTGSLYLVLCS